MQIKCLLSPWQAALLGSRQLRGCLGVSVHSCPCEFSGLTPLPPGCPHLWNLSYLFSMADLLALLPFLRILGLLVLRGNLGPLSRKQTLPGHPAWKVDRGCFHSQLSPPPPLPWPSAGYVQPTLRQPPSIFTGVPHPFPPSKDFRGSPLPSVQGPPSSVCTWGPHCLSHMVSGQPPCPGPSQATQHGRSAGF